VIPCCVDYNATLKLGNARETPVSQLWHASEIERLRERHLNGDFPAKCANCQECETPVTTKRFFYTQTV